MVDYEFVRKEKEARRLRIQEVKIDMEHTRAFRHSTAYISSTSMHIDLLIYAFSFSAQQGRRFSTSAAF